MLAARCKNHRQNLDEALLRRTNPTKGRQSMSNHDMANLAAFGIIAFVFLMFLLFNKLYK